MLAFRAGDDAAFEGLFERWAGRLLRYLERMVGDVATAEELVQETFFRVHRARERYVATARFSTWLYRIATNLALNELKRPRRRHVHEVERTDELEGPGAGVDDLVDSLRTGATVERALAKLPERQRMALWLSAAEGHSYAQVADMLGTSEKSVKALVHRGRAALVARIKGLAGRDESATNRSGRRSSGG
jgi:RNA polymerase sigma-70 factor (ECF subfamily)